MQKFSIDWSMFRYELTCDNKNRFIWRHVLSSEWTAICVFSKSKPSVPSIIELHRKSTNGEFLISGTLDLYVLDNTWHIAQKNFLELLENRYSFLRISVLHSYTNAKSPEMFLMTGEITISEIMGKSVIDFVNMGVSNENEYLSLLD
ncbi:hypothetical protein NPIL_507021 [Nephila pilipes]|uniref:Uncharacterized protein n=1 Tax=Nephila pilipes TaxID=299642 RepID=A0A8X6IC01_NEPPI|nr:hypothetical protein NPIL_507021 [Nephila pilipes]